MQFRALRPTGGNRRSVEPEPEPPSSPVNTTFQNLLAHIPGEASGFYLFGMELLQKGATSATGSPATVPLPDRSDALILGALSLAVLIVFRWLSGSSRMVIITSLLAFIIWMAAFNLGALSIAGWGIHEPLGVIVAAAYSIIVTALANKGIVK